jgi:hypothetical protein
MKFLSAVALILVTVSPALCQRSSYDPAPAKSAPGKSGFIDFALGRINHLNTDYGSQIADWRQFLVEQTLKNLSFWVIGITVSLLMVCFLLLLLENRQRQRREIIVARLLAQYHNAWVDARNHADDAIRRHGELVKRLNAAPEPSPRAAFTGGAGVSSNGGGWDGGPSIGPDQLPETGFFDQIWNLQQLDASRARELNAHQQLRRAQKRTQMTQSPFKEAAD